MDRWLGVWDGLRWRRGRGGEGEGVEKGGMEEKKLFCFVGVREYNNKWSVMGLI